MSPDVTLRPALHPSIVLSAYVEPLVRGRRVAILGDATIGLADELSQRGARLVHVYDPDAARTAEALARAAPGRPHQVSYAVLAGDLGVRDGAFDVVVVPELGIFDDPADVMRRARRLCAASGVAVFVTPNAAGGRRLLPGARNTHGTQAARPDASRAASHDARDAERGVASRGAPFEPVAPPPFAPPPVVLGYYELFDLVSLQFAKVRMIGQAPFVGYTIADFAPRGEPEVSVDTSLLASSEEPEHFIAVASDRPVALDPYAVIELPWSDVADAVVPSDATASVRTGERLALAEAQARATLLSSELEQVREREAERTRAAEERATERATLSARVAELEAEAAARDARLKDSEARAGDNHVRAERLTSQIRDLDEELRRQRDRATKLSKILDDEKKARTKAEVELGMLRGRPEIPGAKERIDALGAEVAAAEARVAELTQELAETRRRPAPPPPPPPPAVDPRLHPRVDELTQALDAALREAADAAALRDAAQERAARAEARLERVAALEADLVAVRREEEDLAQRVAATTAEVADLERRLLAERRRAGDAERHAADGVRRLAEVERQAAEVGRRSADLGRALAGAEKQAADLEARLAERDARIGELDADLAAARAKLADDREDRAAMDAAAAEVMALEAALLDRGRALAALTRDLRESEHVGKELLGELEALRAWNGSAPPVAGPEELRGRLDALAQAAARGEADLQAAAWRIAQLERELAEARREAAEPPRVQLELEQALAAARDEVAALRRTVGAAS